MQQVHPLRRSQRGSAYLAALMVLVVLTIFGLSLVLITQSERQIGTNERTINRNFYAADSGVNVAIARVLAQANHRGTPFTISQGDIGGAANLIQDQVETSCVAYVNFFPCSLCQVNLGTSERFHAVNHAFSSTAQRTAGQRLVSQKQIDLMVELQPRNDTEAQNALTQCLQNPFLAGP